MSVKTCSHCGKVTLKISWSSLRAFEECRQKAKLGMQRKRAALKDIRGFFPGTVTDRVVRDWLQGDPRNTPNIMPDMVAEVMRKAQEEEAKVGSYVEWRSVTDKAQVQEECERAVKGIEPFLNKYVLPFEFRADYRFEAPIQTTRPDGEKDYVLLTGIMDILVKHPLPGTFAVLDVKHTKDESYWRKTVGQLGTYDLGIELLTSKPTAYTALLQPLCKRQFVGYMPTPESRAQLLQRVLAMANAFWLEDLPPKADSKGCEYCDVRHACEKYKIDLSQGKNRVNFNHV